MPEGGGPRLAQMMGPALLASAVVAFAGAYLNDRENKEVFSDDLGNEVYLGSDVTLLLVVLGIVLAINGIVLLAWDRARR